MCFDSSLKFLSLILTASNCALLCFFSWDYFKSNVSTYKTDRNFGIRVSIVEATYYYLKKVKVL